MTAKHTMLVKISSTSVFPLAGIAPVGPLYRMIATRIASVVI